MKKRIFYGMAACAEHGGGGYFVCQSFSQLNYYSQRQLCNDESKRQTRVRAFTWVCVSPNEIEKKKTNIIKKTNSKCFNSN